MIPKVKKILDLSHPLYAACPTYFGAEPPNFYLEQYFARNGFVGERMDMNAHTSTHLDVPKHVFPEGKSVEQMELTAFQGRGVVVDLRGITGAIQRKDMESFDTKVKENDVLLLYTGWAEKYGPSREYLIEYPYIGASAAEWMVEKKIRCVMTDGISAGGTPEGTGLPPHYVLLESEIIIVEEIKLDEQILEEEEWYVTAYPLKCVGFGGSPVRVTATVFE